MILQFGTLTAFAFGQRRGERARVPAGSRDRRILYVTALLRSTATGLIGVQLGIYLTMLDLSAAAIGAILSAGLAGAATAALATTLAADARGRRRTLIELSVLGAIGGVLIALTTHPVALAAAAFVGMLNGMGRDRGAGLILDQAILPSTGADTERTRALAVYNVLQDVGHAIGALLAGLPAVLAGAELMTRLGGHRAGLACYVALLAITAIAYGLLSDAVEAPPLAEPSRARVSPETRRLLVRISALFAIDSLAGGLLVTSLLSYFFFERFGASEVAIAGLFFLARIMNALSHLAAARLARIFGLVNTMVFTHIPSSLLLVTVAFAPSFPVAAVLFLLREGLVEMDVPTRQSYVLAVVQPAERTLASGVTNLVRLAAWAVAPALAGPLMQEVSLMTPLVIGAAMKIGYDVVLYFAFRSVRPPEER